MEQGSLKLDKNLNIRERKEITNLIERYKDIFYKDNEDLTFTNEIRHQIITKNEAPIYSKAYHYPQIFEEEVDKIDQRIEPIEFRKQIMHNRKDSRSILAYVNEICEDAEMRSIEASGSLENMSIVNNIDEEDLETVHSAETDDTDFIRITEKPLNIFKNQIIMKEGNKEAIKTVKIYNKKRHEVIVDSKTSMLDIMKKLLPEKGLVVVFIENTSLFIVFQETYRKYFARNRSLRILKTSKVLQDIMDKELLLRYIEETHLENNHRGITEVGEELRNKIYFPKLQQEVEKYINNCETCQLAKFDRKPVQHELNITTTPTECNEIVHFDIWYPLRNEMFLTSIDRLTKYATIHPLKDRTWVSLIDALKERIRHVGKPKLIITDNELDVITIKQFLKDNHIDFHFTTKYNKTGNADIERLHSTLNEHIRILNADPEKSKLSVKEKVHRTIIYYNNTIHSTHNKRPIEFINNCISREELKEISQKIHTEKEKRINKLNSRKKFHPQQQEFENKYVKNYRVSKSQPKYRKLGNFKKDRNHIVESRNNVERKYYKNQVKRKYKNQN